MDKLRYHLLVTENKTKLLQTLNKKKYNIFSTAKLIGLTIISVYLLINRTSKCYNNIMKRYSFIWALLKSPENQADW